MRVLQLIQRPVPRYTRWGLYPQVVFVVGCWFCMHWWPIVPGVSIGFLALAASIMAVRADSFTPTEKAVWVVISLALCSVELRTIYEDRDQHEREQAAARAEQLEEFKKISAGINTTISVNKKHFDATMNKAQENINYLTGGNSYLYFKVLDPGNPMEIGPRKGLMLANALPTFVGNHPLHNVYVATFCTTTAWLPNIDYGTMFPHEIGRPRQMLELLFRPEGDRQWCNISISTSNGSYSQQVFFLKQGPKWGWASLFFSGRNKKPSKVITSEGFPKDWRASDWN